MKNLQGLWQLLDRWRWAYFWAGVLVLLAVFVLSLEPKVLQVAVDYLLPWYLGQTPEPSVEEDPFTWLIIRWLPDPSTHAVNSLLIALGGVYLFLSVLRGIGTLASSALNAQSTESAMKKLRDRLFLHLQMLPLSYYTTISKGELIQRCTGDIDTIRNFAQTQIVEIVRLSAIFIFSFAMLWLIDPYFALICVALTGLIGAQGFYFFRFEKKIWEAHENEADKLNKIAQENIAGIRVVQSFANEAVEKEKFDRQNRAKLAIGIRHIRLHTLFWPVSDFLVLFQIVLSILFGGWYAMEATITLGELLTAYTYLVMVSWPMRQLGRMLSQTGMAMVAFERITQILSTSPEAYQEGYAHGLIEGDIVFQDVTFAYDPNSPEPVLKNVSFHIRKGEKVALIGPTSAGKTTVINLLTRLYEPQSGAILIDGKPISTFSKPYLRANIGVVLQKPFLFSTSVLGNIAYAKPEASTEAIREAAQAAQAHTIEEALPQGFQTVVGEKGVTLSGGQKQRVALARTLLQQPDILVLDDITSAVDTQTEKAIFQSLQQLLQQKTTIIISHRVSSIMHADRVLVLDQGKVVAEGTPETLAKEPGYYREILALQADLEEDILSSVLPKDA